MWLFLPRDAAVGFVGISALCNGLLGPSWLHLGKAWQRHLSSPQAPLCGVSHLPGSLHKGGNWSAVGWAVKGAPSWSPLVTCSGDTLTCLGSLDLNCCSAILEYGEHCEPMSLTGL